MTSPKSNAGQHSKNSAETSDDNSVEPSVLSASLKLYSGLMPYALCIYAFGSLLLCVLMPVALVPVPYVIFGCAISLALLPLWYCVAILEEWRFSVKKIFLFHVTTSSILVVAFLILAMLYPVPASPVDNVSNKGQDGFSSNVFRPMAPPNYASTEGYKASWVEQFQSRADEFLKREKEIDKQVNQLFSERTANAQKQREDLVEFQNYLRFLVPPALSSLENSGNGGHTYANSDVGSSVSDSHTATTGKLGSPGDDSHAHANSDV